jgi:hypothetical protein
MLSGAELKAWYQDSWQFSGLACETVYAPWQQQMSQPRQGLPPGLLARLIGRLTQQNLTPAPEASEENVLKLLLRGAACRSVMAEMRVRGAVTAIWSQALELILSRLHSLDDPVIQFPPEQIADLPELQANPDFPARYHLTRLYEALCEELQQRPPLLDTPDLFEIHHSEWFQSVLARDIYRKLSQFHQQLQPWLQANWTLREESPQLVLSCGDPQMLPLGGYDSLSNRGELASLLTSELALMDPAEPVDYFDYKYLHGELLYFSREQGAVFRIRRHVHLIWELDASFEHLDNFVALLGVTLALCGQILKCFRKDLVEIDIYLTETRPTWLAEALPLVQFLLAEAHSGAPVQFKTEFPLPFQPSRSDVQHWLIGSVAPALQALDLHQIPFDFLTSARAFRQLQTGQSMRWGQAINQIINEMVKNADR